MTTEPPSDVGAPHRIATYAGPTSVFVIQHGSDGTPGLRAPVDSDGVPTPAVFFAETRKMYGVPLTRSVTVTARNVVTVSTKVDQLEPLLDEYSMT